ncbi:MAG: VanZ family protein [Hespellia sp.]|nr:VanZ family protein [Hespellia sp.]
MQNEQSREVIQYTIFDALKDLIMTEPIFLLGIIIIGVLLVSIFRKNRTVPRIKTVIISLLLYHYLCILFTNVVGIPTLSEFFRISKLGESFFNPTINLIPLGEGLTAGFIMNVLLFAPLGFLCPLLSRTYEKFRHMFLLGFSLSLFIEISQLFTLYRVTDIDDLLANVLGTIIGYLCFRLLVKMRIVKLHRNQGPDEETRMAYLPIVIIAVAFLLGFFS